MKTIKFYLSISVVTLVIIAVTVVSCNKEIDVTEELSLLIPASTDADAGTWDMIVLASPNTAANETAVPNNPALVTSDAYLAEIAAIKDAQSKLTDGQRKAIEYWSAGGVLRWNQMFRKLVARYNLPPAPKADNTYPAPDAENPFGDPNFPFANPPYAARAYSYVSVAQYEALKAAWHYKYVHNRPSPFKVDNAIKSLMPETGLPAYPSEDAVMSGVTADMLKNLFPAAVEEITLMAAQQRNVALWSGRATASDISAGLALGKAVATQVLASASTDGMRAAGGSPVIWKSLADNVGYGNFVNNQQTPWISLDNPKRPPMLPVFGQVRAWNMTKQQIIDNRPIAPPSTSSAEMKAEVDEVKWYSKNLTRERLAIVHKWADGAGTYTPPGHWNDIAAEYIEAENFSEVRAARAFALLNMAMHDAAVGCWETKFHYFNPRPSQMDPSIKTGTGVPNFPAFTSGHSTFSGSAAVVLSYLFPEESEYFHAQAKEASDSRLFGGIHYRSDIEMGLSHGELIGGFTRMYALTDGAD
jgi:hypothetical protein